MARVGAETVAGTRSFLRRRAAVFFTFFFPAIVILIFAGLVQTDAAGGGLFTEPAGYYAAGYLATVVLFTPLSRLGHEVARHRDGNRFEKLATTPLRRWEWLLGQALVNVAVVLAAAALVLVMVVALTGATVVVSPLLVPYLVLGVALFAGFGAVVGRVTDSQDGVVAASNGVALPLLFLSETFVPPSLLPDWLPLWLSPLTYFSRGVRAVTYEPPAGGTPASDALGGLSPGVFNLLVLAALAAAFFLLGALAVPRTD